MASEQPPTAAGEQPATAAGEHPVATTDEHHLRAQAIDRLKRKRDFRNHLFVFVLVIASLWVIWAVTGFGFPWPIFPMLGWGIGLAFHGFDTYRQPFTEEDVQVEARRLRGSS
jgi:2TM domain